LLSARLGIPSTKTRLLEEAPPAALKLVVLKPEPLPFAEVNELPEVSDTPGTSRARLLVRRKLSGRSTISRSSMTVPILALVVLRSGAAPLT
jgi:hypothetical protein